MNNFDNEGRETEESARLKNREAQKILLDMAVELVEAQYQKGGTSKENFPSPTNEGEGVSYGLKIGLCLLSKNILTENAKKEVYEMIDREFGLTNGNIDQIIEHLGQQGFDKEEIDGLLRHPHWIFSAPDKFSGLFFRLLELASKSKNQAFDSLLKKFDRLLRIYSQSRFIPIEQEITQELLRSGKLEDLAGKKSHKKNDKNQSLAEIVNMKKSTEGEDVDNSRSAFSQQINDERFYQFVSKTTRNGMVDFRVLAAEFSELAQRVGQMSGDLKYLSLTGGIGKDNPAIANILLTRIGILAELDELNVKQDGIYSLEKLKTMDYSTNTKTFNTEAKRQFEIGKKCLSSAESKHDLADAKKAFEKAVNIDPTSAIAQFALGLTLRLMAEYGEASKTFQKALTYAAKNQNELAALACQSIAEIEYRITGDLPLALEMAEKAIELDDGNTAAKYEKARYLATAGLVDEALEQVEKLVEEDETFLLRMKIDPAFQSIKKERLREFIEGIIKKRQFRNQQAALVAIEMKKG